MTVTDPPTNPPIESSEVVEQKEISTESKQEEEAPVNPAEVPLPEENDEDEEDLQDEDDDEDGDEDDEDDDEDDDIDMDDDDDEDDSDDFNAGNVESSEPRDSFPGLDDDDDSDSSYSASNEAPMDVDSDDGNSSDQSFCGFGGMGAFGMDQGPAPVHLNAMRHSFDEVAKQVKDQPRCMFTKDTLQRNCFQLALLRCDKEMALFLVKTMIEHDNQVKEDREKLAAEAAVASEGAGDKDASSTAVAEEKPPASPSNQAPILSQPDTPSSPSAGVLILDRVLKSPYHGYSTLHLACIGLFFEEKRAGAEEIVRAILVHRNADEIKDEEDKSGCTALHLAAKAGSESVVKLLLEKGFDPNKTDTWGFWPLHYALESKNGELVKLLTTLVDKSRDFQSFAFHPLSICIETQAWHYAAILLENGLSLPEEFFEDASKMAEHRGLLDDFGKILNAYSNPDEAFDINQFENEDMGSQTAVYTHKDCYKHGEIPDETDDPSLRNRLVATVAENASRLEVLVGPNGILKCDEFKSTTYFENGDPVCDTDMLRVHELDYIRKITHLSEGLQGHNPYRQAKMDGGDTQITRGSWAAARAAAGCVIQAVDAVCTAEGIRNAFCAVRPPGHHLGPSGGVGDDLDEDEKASMGFCLLNNIAIGAAYARNVYRHMLSKVAIIDIDVHHGNGTEAIVRNLGFKNRPVHFGPSSLGPVSGFQCLFNVPGGKPWLDSNDDKENVFFASIHGYGDGFYPGTGHTGVDQSPPIVNVAMSQGSHSNQFRNRMRREVLQPLMEFNPDIVFVSAGFDGHTDDLIGVQKFDERDFQWVTEQLLAIANKCSEGRLVSVLEGGYNQRAGFLSPLALSVGRHVKTLMTTSPNYVTPEMQNGFTEEKLHAAEIVDTDNARIRSSLRPDDHELREMLSNNNKRAREDDEDEDATAKRSKILAQLIAANAAAASSSEGGAAIPDLAALISSAVASDEQPAAETVEPAETEEVVQSTETAEVAGEMDEIELFGEVESSQEPIDTQVVEGTVQTTEQSEPTESMDVE